MLFLIGLFKRELIAASLFSGLYGWGTPREDPTLPAEASREAGLGFFGLDRFFALSIVAFLPGEFERATECELGF